MLTKSDKKWIDEKFATKDDLTASSVRIRTEMHEIRDELKEEIRSSRDELMTVLDKIMGEVVKGREHDLVVAHQIEKLNKRVFVD